MSDRSETRDLKMNVRKTNSTNNDTKIAKFELKKHCWKKSGVRGKADGERLRGKWLEIDHDYFHFPPACFLVSSFTGMK